MLAGTEEAPGAEIVRQGRRYKVVRGMASLSANVERRKLDDTEIEFTEEDWTEVVPEGVEAFVPYRGEVADILTQIAGGLRSGMSYAGARTITELWDRCRVCARHLGRNQRIGVARRQFDLAVRLTLING